MADPNAELTGEFMKQFGGSAVANVVCLLGFALLVALKKCCDRPSRCKSHLHCPCLDVEVMDRSQTIRGQVPKTTDESGPSAV